MKSPFQLFKSPVKQPIWLTRIEWNRVRQDQFLFQPLPAYEKMKEEIKIEHGYDFPEPVWIWKDIQSTLLFKENLDSIFSDIQQHNLQIALTHAAKELNLSTAVEDFWVAYSFYTPIYMELSHMPEREIENTAQCHYLYNWYHMSGQQKESSVDVGHACCTLQIFINPNKFLLTWWERETQVLDNQNIEEWAETIKKELEQVFQQWTQTQGKQNDYFEKFLTKFFTQAHLYSQRARTEAKDPDLWFYQNPKWEKYYAKLEGMEWVKKHFAKNRHPDSLKWVDK